MEEVQFAVILKRCLILTTWSERLVLASRGLPSSGGFARTFSSPICCGHSPEAVTPDNLGEVRSLDSEGVRKLGAVGINSFGD